jgi:hypothetical protein
VFVGVTFIINGFSVGSETTIVAVHISAVYHKSASCQ